MCCLGKIHEPLPRQQVLHCRASQTARPPDRQSSTPVFSAADAGTDSAFLATPSEHPPLMQPHSEAKPPPT